MTDIMLDRIFPGPPDPKGVERVRREDTADNNLDDELADLATWRTRQAETTT